MPSKEKQSEYPFKYCDSNKRTLSPSRIGVPMPEELASRQSNLITV